MAMLHIISQHKYQYMYHHDSNNISSNTEMAAWNNWKASFRQGSPNPLQTFTPQCEASSIYWRFQDQT